MKLETARLTLRECVSDDLGFLWDYWQHESFYRFRAIDIPTFEYTQKILKSYIDDQSKEVRLNYYLLCENRSTQQPIGLASLRINSNDLTTAELGGSVHHQFYNDGYATEASEALIDFARTLGLKTVYALCVADNAPARKVLEKRGFILEGYLDNPKEIRGARPAAVKYNLPL